MKKIFQSVLDFLLFSNVFMALCAVAQALCYVPFIANAAHIFRIGLTVYIHLRIYNFCILIDKKTIHKIRLIFVSAGFMHASPVDGHHYHCYACFALVPLFFLISIQSRLLTGVFRSYFSFAYGLPLFTIGDHKFGLRNIPGLKPFLITLVWTLSIVLLPVLEGLRTQTTPIISIGMAWYTFGQTLSVYCRAHYPFDIRDLLLGGTAKPTCAPYPWFGANGTPPFVLPGSVS